MKRLADVIFCIDTSDSMRPCIDAVRQNVVAFATSLQSPGQQQNTWDVRFELLSYSAGEYQEQTVFQQRSLFISGWQALNDALYRKGNGSLQRERFFTSDLAHFRDAIQQLQVVGDEATLVALDTCLDFPWRDAADCHRVVILLTDEPLETGVYLAPQVARIPELIAKIQALGVMLFLVGPESQAFNQLCAADRSEYRAIGQQGNGLADVNFDKVLARIGRSVSQSTTRGQGSKPPILRALFGQTNWVLSNAVLRGS